MKLVEYSNRKGSFFKVSDESFKEILVYKWCLNNKGYAVTSIKGKVITLQRFLLEAFNGKEVDHKDGDKSNYQLNNLRIVTPSQNQWNQKIRKTGTSKYKGVSWQNKSKKWLCQIQVSYKNIYLGSFNSELEAAKVYDSKAKEYFGEYAKLNFVY